MPLNQINWRRPAINTYAKANWLLGGAYFFIFMLARSDMWDGVIVSYASKAERYGGLRRLTADTDLDSVYGLFRAEIFIAHLFHLDFITVDRVVLFASLVSICISLHRIACNQLRVEKHWSTFTVFLFMSFPTFHVFASSTQTFYVVFIAFCLGGVQLLHQERPLLKVFGLLALIISFEMNSLIVFAPALAIFYEISRLEILRFTERVRTPTLVGALGALYWFISRSLSEPSGNYLGYNKFLNPLNQSGWVALKSGFSTYATFMIIPVVGISILACTTVVIGGTGRRSEVPPSENSHGAIGALILLISAATAPYILVYKSTFVDDFDWDGRHSILLSIPLSLLVMVFTRSLFKTTQWTRLHRLVLLGMSLLLLIGPQISVQTYGLTKKLGRQSLELKMIEAIKNVKPKPGLVEIVGLPILVPDFRVYGANYLMYRAYGEDAWWTRIGSSPDPNFSVPAWMSRRDNQEIYIYTPGQTTCRTVITLAVSRYGSFGNNLKMALRLADSTTVSLSATETTCP